MKKPKLILVKHSTPEIIPSLPANKWRLSNDGRVRCGPLAEKLAAFEPEVIYSSLEPKAVETAEEIATALGLVSQAHPGLHEHLRETAGYFPTTADFQAAVLRFFNQPFEVVFGEESAHQAQARFQAAVEAVLLEHPDQTIVVTTHGTVLTLFVALYEPIDPYSFWERLTLPSFVVIERPSLNLIDTILFP